MKSVKKLPTATKARHSYQFDTEGCPLPRGVMSVLPQAYGWGNVAGIALVSDLFKWRKVLSEEQAKRVVANEVQSLLEEAFTKIQSHIAEPRGLYQFDHAGVAVGFWEGISELIGFALESPTVAQSMEDFLAKSVRRYEAIDRMDTEEAKAVALKVCALDQSK